MRKKLLLATAAALAISAPVRAADLLPPPPPPPVFTWTGPYIGGQIGYAWGPSTFDLLGLDLKTLDVLVLTSSNSPSGVVGGAHVGYLYQISQFVIGLEGSVDGTSLRANAQFFLPDFIGSNNVLSAHATADVQGTVRGKLGFAWDRVLIYGTGGVAFGGFTSNLILNGLTPTTVPFPIGNRYFSNSLTGWTAGGGIEYAVTDNWWIFAEYRFTDFGSFNNTLANGFTPKKKLLGIAVVTNSNPQLQENQVQVGFSYRFNLLPPPPVVVKY
jgi:outer membrane immunogenic protein